MAKQIVDVDTAIRQIRERDPRYPVQAYRFVRESLDYTLATQRKRGHVRGQELLDGLRRFAIDQYGPLALTVFHNWNVQRTEDIGEMVFNMVEVGILGKTDEDSKEDFADGFDFQEAFGQGFSLDSEFRL